MACASTCLTQDHDTYGACLRSKNMQISWCKSAKGLDRSAEKAKDRELDSYKEARDSGIQPDGTHTSKIRFAVEQSEKHGARYGEDFNVVPKANRKGFDPVFKKDIDKAMKECLPSDIHKIYETAKKLPGSGVH